MTIDLRLKGSVQNAIVKVHIRVCLKNSLIRNFGRRCAISASQSST